MSAQKGQVWWSYLGRTYPDSRTRGSIWFYLGTW